MEWLKIVALSFSMILIGFIILRLVAKRSFNEMSPFNIFLVLMLANILADPIEPDHIVEIFIPVLVIFLSFFIYSYLQNTNRLGKAIKGKPLVLIRHGNIDEKALNQAKISLSEMLAELRVKGFSHVQDVEFAILEESGKVSVIPNSSKRPLTTGDVSYVPGYEGIPVPLIMDGVIQYDNLAKIKMSPKDLLDRLRLQGYEEEMIKTISLAVLDERNNIITDQNDDINQGNIPQQQQTIWTKIYEDMHAARKSPEDKDLGMVDDYIKPKP